MFVERQGSAVIVLALISGIFLSPLVDHQSILLEMGEQVHEELGIETEELEPTVNQYVIFNVVVNDTDKRIGDERFVENSMVYRTEIDSIFYRNQTGVTWNSFFDSLNYSEINEDNICISVNSSEICGDGRAVLNGEEADLEENIDQGDNMLIVIDSEDEEEIINEFMGKNLPEPFKRQEIESPV